MGEGKTQTATKAGVKAEEIAAKEVKRIKKRKSCLKEDSVGNGERNEWCLGAVNQLHAAGGEGGAADLDPVRRSDAALAKSVL